MTNQYMKKRQPPVKISTVKSAVNELFGRDFEISRIKGTLDIFEFYNDELDKGGLFNATIKKVIVPLNTMSDVSFHKDLEMISYFSWKINDLVWITAEGTRILSGGEIIETITSGYYFIKKSEQNLDRTQINFTTYLFQPFPDPDDNEEHETNKYLIPYLDRWTLTEDQRYLLAETLQYQRIRKMGVYDLKTNQWIHELKEIQAH